MPSKLQPRYRLNPKSAEILDTLWTTYMIRTKHGISKNEFLSTLIEEYAQLQQKALL